MRWTMTWWRNLSGLLVACVLTLLVVAPTVSMATCRCESDAVLIGVETNAAVVEVMKGDAPDHRSPCEAACCANGHCHHGGTMLDAPGVAALAPAPLVSEHVTAPSRALASSPLSGLDRPPRA